MFVLLVFAVTAAITNGAQCPDADSNGEVDCFEEGLDTIPQLPVEAIEV